MLKKTISSIVLLKEFPNKVKTFFNEAIVDQIIKLGTMKKILNKMLTSGKPIDLILQEDGKV